MIKLSKAEIKVLDHLERNARFPASHIAKSILLSTEGVIKIINRLKKEGILSKTEAKINFSRLGYTVINCYIRFKKIDQQIKDYIASLRKEKIIGYSKFCEGNEDLILSFKLLGTEDLYRMHKILSQELGDKIKEKKIGIVVNASELSKSTIKKEFEVINISLRKEKISDDAWTVLEELKKNARVTLVDISATRGITPATSAKIIKQLEKKRIISGYKSITEPTRLGLQNYSLLINPTNLTEKDTHRFATFLKNIREARYFVEMIGTYKYELEIQVEHIERLYQITDQIRKEFDIDNINTLVFREH